MSALFEGVVTGAADGYWRMRQTPAATLLHLGPGLGNGLANLHNAKKANSGIVNIVGEHASYHIKYDAPLTADIEDRTARIALGQNVHVRRKWWQPMVPQPLPWPRRRLGDRHPDPAR